ncbi:MAG: hypothetical protein AAGH40_07185 [Verrucomicrobiota bacterium]
MTKTTQGFPAITLWYKPALTMQVLIKSGQGHGWAVFFAALFGIVQSWRFYVASEEASVLIFALGGALGVIGLFFFGWLLRNFSRWFGASPLLKSVRTALGLSLLPWTVMFAILIGLIGNQNDAGAVAGLFPVFFFVFVYGYVILLLSLAAVFDISILKTFLCLVVTMLVSFFPITLVLQLLLGSPVAP